MNWTAKARLSYYIGILLRLNTWAWRSRKKAWYTTTRSINDEYKPKKALISKILGIADNLNGDRGLKKG
jgi:hypothetical protein